MHVLLDFFFSREEYSIKAKVNANSLAYTQGYLQLHTDSPYYEYMPGVNNYILHINVKHLHSAVFFTDKLTTLLRSA